METTQLILLFICGYLLSRLFVRARLPERVVFLLVSRELTFGRLVLYLIGITAGLSVLIPNALTAITVLPVVTLLQRQWHQHKKDHRARVTTALALAVIYGANIGGIGAITGTPANGVLVGYAALQGIDGESVLRFDTWLLWGLPLAATLVVLGWAVIMLTLARPHASEAIETLRDWHAPSDPRQVFAYCLAAGFLLASFGLSAAMRAFDAQLVVISTAILAVAFAATLFLWKFPVGEDRSREPLLRPQDVFSALPLRGLLFVAGFVVLATTLAALGVVQAIARVLAHALPMDIYSFPALSLIALLTSFTTEMLSNTVVQLGMFETLSAHSGSDGQLIYPLLAVTLSCTCAFMSPVATGTNGLVFGEMRGASLWRMLVAGMFMNLVAGLTIAAWVRWLVP
jgi:sodium-dependent dicarboxylate transporter 2/3/5